MHCGGSTTIDVSDVDDSNQHSRRGSLLHELAHQCLSSGKFLVGEARTQTNTEDYEIADEDWASVDTYVRFVKTLPGRHFYEKRTMFIPDCGGTTDCAVVERDLLHVIDFKAGYVKVSPIDNPQITIYALGMLRKYRALFDIKRVRLTIVQPMRLAEGEEPPSWEISAAMLRLMGKKIKERVRALEAREPDAVTFVPRVDRCRFCTVGRVGRCPALNERALVAAKAEFAEWEADRRPKYMTKTIDEMTELELFEMASVVELWAKRRKESVTSKVKMGTHVQGFKLVAGKRTRTVTDRAGLVTRLTEDGFGEQEIFVGEPELVSPHKAEKLYAGKGSGAKKKELEKYFQTEEGAPLVVPEHDPRPAVDLLDRARRDFVDHFKETEENGNDGD